MQNNPSYGNGPAPQPPMGQGLPPQGSPPPHRSDQGSPAYPGYGPPAGYPQPPAAPFGAPATPYGAQPYYPPRKPNSGKAIASLVCGVVSVFIWPFAIFAGPAGIVLGIMGLKETRPDSPKTGRGFAIGGLITSSIMLVLCLVIGAAIGLGIYYGEKQSTTFRNERAQQDLTLICQRLTQYAQENNGSLGPGGPVLASSGSYYAYQAGNGAPPAAQRVSGTLALHNLVTDYELSGSLSDYELRITGTSSAVITYRNGNARAEVTDAALGNWRVNSEH